MIWLRTTALLTWSEVLRLSRTEQVFRTFLVPALIGLPVLVMMSVLVSSFAGDKGSVAIPASDLGGLPVQRALEAERLRVIVAPDPMALWERGEVDVALVSVKPGEGIYARRDPELASREAWLIDIVSDDAEVTKRVSAAMSDAADASFDAIVSLSGGVPGEVRVARVRTVGFKDELAPGFDLIRGLRAYTLMGISALSLYFLTLPMLADRREGVTEAMCALPIPITAMLWSRVLANTGLQLLGSGLLLANAALLLPLLEGRFSVPPFWVEVPGHAAALFATNGLYVAVGVLAATPKTANNISSLVMLIQMGLYVWGVFGAPFTLVPFAGVIAAADPVGRSFAVAGCLALGALTITSCGRLLQARASLVLPRSTA